MESVKAASDIFAPVSGIIQDINETLDTKPTLVNMSPEDAGKACSLFLTGPDRTCLLMTWPAQAGYASSNSLNLTSTFIP